MKIKSIFVFLTAFICIGLISCDKGKDTATTGAVSMDTSTKIVIPGTGSSLDLLRVVANRFMAINAGETVEIPPSTGSAGGIKAVMENTANVARVSRTLKDNEKASGLAYEVFASTPIVFASHPDIKIKNLKTSDIIKIYSGQIKNWKQLGGKDQAIVLIGREESDSSRQVIEKQIKEYKTIAFPKEMTVVTKDQEMINTVKVKPGAIGFGTFANMKSERLNIFNLDGNVPGKEKYPLMGEYAFVYYKDKLSPLSKKFLDFVFSDEGKKIIESEFCIVIPRQK